MTAPRDHPPSVRARGMFYRGDADLLAGLVPFVREGLERDEAVVVALPGRGWSCSATHLGDDAEGSGSSRWRRSAPIRHGSSACGPTRWTRDGRPAHAAGRRGARLARTAGRWSSSSASSTSSCSTARSTTGRRGGCCAPTTRHSCRGRLRPRAAGPSDPLGRRRAGPAAVPPDGDVAEFGAPLRAPRTPCSGGSTGPATSRRPGTPSPSTPAPAASPGEGGDPRARCLGTGDRQRAVRRGQRHRRPVGGTRRGRRRVQRCGHIPDPLTGRFIPSLDQEGGRGLLPRAPDLRPRAGALVPAGHDGPRPDLDL